MRLFQRIAMLLLVGILLFTTYHHAFQTHFTASSNDLIHVQLLGINDLHGQLDQYQQLQGKRVGGAEYLASHLQAYQEKNPHTLLVHTGDMVGGSPPISSLFNDEPTIEFLNLLNVDIGTPGNHEFDRGVAEMKRLIHGESPQEKGNFKGATAQYTSANILDKKTGETVFRPYVIKKINGVNMGFIGVVTTDTNDFVLANSREEVMITDEVNAINKSVKQLKEQGIRSIVVLAHVSVQSDQNGGNPKEDLAEMAYKVDDEVDVMLGAHNHQYANTVVDDKLLVQAYSYGKAFSQVELGIDKRTEEIAYKQAEIVPVEHESVKPDPKVMTFLQTYKDQLGTDAGKSIGTLPYQLTRKKNERAESPLAQLVAEASRKEMQADIALVHHGGIRASLPKGDVTKKDLYTAFPFEHHLVKIEVTGGDLYEILEQQWSEKYDAALQTAGITVEWNDLAPFGERIEEIKAESGEPIELTQTYTIALSNYLQEGGDGFSKLTSTKVLQKGPLIVDAVAMHFEDSYPLVVQK
ncbi:bifunctional metallophosphatase/5'-nucleotidase [Priestia flexa]|uniref:Bifunctional metallophosphatase/5'-nucleotidase n=2 Tax=Priestia flexa TaxID=86664 RepID=A0A8I1MHU1_9BACI|nr:bifunctional metallophosphatase/5'-nucleotidase [Priestia flexa]MBN8252610.1 bifunctional metallophosphatase/5'-nucleotidase [Priestia flexa]MBN8434081.1 bifunctional metallophosphatase/5'-nucleotidase [Priestia flexa]MCA0966614.1 bifunctional metallophosphatase/5'-nucleotidase [Priestia flexa]WHX80128.1 bifunctional metallophosphatase/5'-nucleotidase [Priestia flexa]